MSRLTTRLYQVTRALLRRLLAPTISMLVDVVDRERARRCARKHDEVLRMLASVGVEVKIAESATITEPRTVCLGNNVSFGPHARLVTEGGLTVGDNTHFDSHVSIYTTRPNPDSTALPNDYKPLLEPVAIGSNVWVGAQVTIMPNVTISEGAMIRAGTVVSEDVAARAIVGPDGTHSIGERDAIQYAALNADRVYCGPNKRRISAERLARYYRHGDAMHSQLFFVLSTGRSGSMSIAHMFDQHPEIKCRHEPRGQLIRLSTELAHGTKTPSQVRAELEALYVTAGVFPPGWYGESDQKLWNLVPILDSLLPDTRLIWLLRDGRQAVASSFARGWYSADLTAIARPVTAGRKRVWEYFRLDGARCGVVSPEEWAAMSAFERNCWYWGYVNTTIENYVSRLDDGRWYMVRLCDLAACANDLFEFLDTSSASVELPWMNVGERQHGDWQQWDMQQKTSFDRWCGAVMDRHFPGWRQEM